jgi:hypothetical protein
VVKETQLWTKKSTVFIFKSLPDHFSEEIADLVESLDYTVEEDSVPEQGIMQAIGSDQVLLT